MTSSMEELAKQYGPAPEDVVHPDETPLFERGRPSKDEVRASISATEVGDVPDDVADIDPSQWLSHDDSFVIDYVYTRAGRLKIAALDENDQEACRKHSERVKMPGRPQMGREVNLKQLRLWTIAFSLNKAYAYWGTANELSAKLIESNKKLTGEITTLVNRIYEISGYKGDDTSSSSFFSVS